MQKDFKIGLAIGVTLAAAAVLWLATLPNLSARARALQAASNIAPSPKAPSIAPQAVSSPQPTDTGIITSDEPRVTSDESRAMSSDTSASNAERTTQNAEQQRIHIVQKGDTLSSISAKYYGSARQWRKIVLANRDNLPDPNRLVLGAKLVIPE